MTFTKSLTESLRFKTYSYFLIKIMLAICCHCIGTLLKQTEMLCGIMISDIYLNITSDISKCRCLSLMFACTVHIGELA